MNISDLKTHLNKYKDALVLVGPGAIKSIATIPSKEEQQKYLNSKCLRRTPEEFWKFYFDNFYIDIEKVERSKTQEALMELVDLNLVSTVTTLYPDGLFNIPGNVIDLHGNMQWLQCQKATCKNLYPVMAMKTDTGHITECEVCGSKLKPSILMFGETYNEEKYQAMIALLNKTHTLITIGLDYTETPIVDLIADYCELKAQQNAESKDEEKILVSVADKDLDMDLNEQIGYHEFIVRDDCDAAMIRLLELLK